MRNEYDPRTRSITLRPDASLYAYFHELAHKEQHDTGAIAFELWCRLKRLRVLGHLLLLWVELDALRRARRALRRMGCWTDEAKSEAYRGFMSYIRQEEPDTGAQLCH